MKGKIKLQTRLSALQLSFVLLRQAIRSKDFGYPVQSVCLLELLTLFGSRSLKHTLNGLGSDDVNIAGTGRKGMVEGVSHEPC